MPKQARNRLRSSQRGRRRPSRGRIFRLSVTRNPSFISYLPLIRTILTCLPFTSSGIFDLVFNYIIASLSQVKNYIGAFAMFGVTPGSLLVNSPLLAKDTSGTFSFPSYPVKVKHLRLKLIDTTQAQERSGRWAAVFIPYREPHDANHYTTKLKDLTFAELVSMPAAVSGPCLKQLVINYRMRDLTDYCSRPRELAEEIGVVMIIWDCGNRDNFTKEPKKYSIYSMEHLVVAENLTLLGLGLYFGFSTMQEEFEEANRHGIALLQELQVLPTRDIEKRCPNCQAEMNTITDRQRTLGWRYRCNGQAETSTWIVWQSFEFQSTKIGKKREPSQPPKVPVQNGQRKGPVSSKLPEPSNPQSAPTPQRNESIISKSIFGIDITVTEIAPRQEFSASYNRMIDVSVQPGANEKQLDRILMEEEMAYYATALLWM
ncbi:hypothetical protein FQA39_LY14035 [Lamprigera yunnana]|nr:hypothetical protein FQA39_LY14035 [Lamprigera yunnana]